MDYGDGPNGTKKGKGWYGELHDSEGNIVTEMTVGINIDGEEVDVPAVNPILSEKQLTTLLGIKSDQPLPEDIIDTAVEYAIFRKQQGRGMYAEGNEVGSAEYKGNLKIKQ